MLKPDGELIFVDWGKPSSLYTKLAFVMLRLFDGWKNTADNGNGNYLKMLEMAGFTKPERVSAFSTVYGTLELVRTKKEVL